MMKKERRHRVSSVLKMIGPVEAELSVTVSKSDVEAALNKAYGMLRRTARVRGFRQGRAPRNLLQRMYGKAVRADVQKELVRDHLLRAFQENEIEPLTAPSIEETVLNENEEFNFKVTFEARPKLEKLDYEGIELERRRVTVGQEEIDAETERLRSALASVSDLPEPRPAQKGDVAKISMKRWVDGNWEESGLPDQEVVIGDGDAPAELDEALMGMRLEEEKVVDLGSTTALDENRLRYLVRLTALKERKLPALDDELAKDTGDYDTLADLKKDIEKRLLEAKNRAEDQRIRIALFDALRKKNEIPLPPSLLERQTEVIQNQFFGQIASQIKSDDEKGQETLSNLDESAEKAAREMVHQHLLMMEIARIENIKVEDEDIEKEIEKRANASGVPVPLVRADMNKEGRREDLAQQILETKIFDFIRASVTIKELDRPAGEDAGEKPAKKAASKKTTAKKAVKEEMSPVPKEARDTADLKKPTPKKKTAEKTGVKKAPAKKAPAKKTAAKKTATKKTEAKKSPAKKTATKKTATKKSATKK
jgi:trigger factor